MPLGREVGLSPGDIVLDGDPGSPPPKVDGAHQFSAHVYCGHRLPSQLLLSSCTNVRPIITTRMWADALRDGRPANIGSALYSTRQSLADAQYWSAVQ